MTALLTLHDIHKYYGATHALRGIDLAVASGEVVVLLGPSGCGKSTLLRCINGLEPIQGGNITCKAAACSGGTSAGTPPASTSAWFSRATNSSTT